MAEILTVGEIMLRLQPFGYKRFLQADAFEAVFGGGEANVAVSLAGFGEEVAFVSALPDNAIGDKCVRDLKGRGVETSFILRKHGRMGIYFCEKGCSVRPSNVIYDRADSTICSIDISDFDLDKLFYGVKWLHFTGITPALSDKTAVFTLELLKAAKMRGVIVSCDLNYRKKLWSKQRAQEIMSNLVLYVDYLISNEEDTKDVFGLKAEGADILGGRLSADGYKKLGYKVMDMFKNIKGVAFTLRESVSASVNGWSSVFITRENAYSSKHYTLDIVDRVGGGDSFGAGLIYGLKNGWDNQSTIEFATAASAFKHTIEGDFNEASVLEIKKLAEGDDSGRISR